jgi:hypothetical protein
MPRPRPAEPPRRHIARPSGGQIRGGARACTVRASAHAAAAARATSASGWQSRASCRRGSSMSPFFQLGAFSAKLILLILAQSGHTARAGPLGAHAIAHVANTPVSGPDATAPDSNVGSYRVRPVPGVPGSYEHAPPPRPSASSVRR